MTDFQQRYKEKPLGFGGVNEGRLVRFERREQERKQERSRAVNKNRNIPDSANTSLQNAGSSEPVVEDRLTRLKKWKLEREKKKRAQSRKQKPPFKVGIVRHKIYSPTVRDENIQRIGSSKIHAVPVPKPGNKISKATEKRLKAKALRDATQQTSKQQKEEKSFAPVDHQFKPPIGLPEMPLFGRVAFLPMDDKINNFLLSPSPRMRRSIIRRSNASTLTVKDLSLKENRARVEKNSSSEDAVADNSGSSIETVTLKLSSDEQGLSDSPTNSMKKMCRTSEVDVDRSVSYVNSDQTPDKSILEKSKEMMKTDSVVKSLRKVNFNENIVLNEVPVDEETQAKVDSARSLARIECFDFDFSRTQAELPVERKLTFDTNESMSDESGDVSHNIDEQKQSSSKRSTSKQMTLLSLPTISIRLEGLTPAKESPSHNPKSDSPKRNLKSKKKNQSVGLNQSLELLNNSNTTRRKLTRQDAFDESSSDTDDENIRVLRNRSISCKTTPKSTRRRKTKVTMSEPNFREKENESPLRTKRKSSLKLNYS